MLKLQGTTVALYIESKNKYLLGITKVSYSYTKKTKFLKVLFR